MSDEGFLRVDPLIIQAEARREAREIYTRLHETVEDRMKRIEQRRGRQMARLVMVYLTQLESEIPSMRLLMD